MEDLLTLTRGSRRQLRNIEAHWQEGLQLSSAELCATAIVCLSLHITIALPELLSSMAWELEELEQSRRLLEQQL